MTLRELAERLGCGLQGDGEIEVVRVAGVEHAGPGDLTFLANPKYARAVAHTKASAILLPEHAPDAPCAMLRTREPYLMFGRALTLLHPQHPPAPGVHPSAVVEEGATIAEDAAIAAFAFVGAGARVGPRTSIAPFCHIGRDVRIGADCRLHSHVAVRERVVLGDRVVVQNGVVIGSDGFGFATRADGTHEKVPQVGSVVIGDDVEIGANSTIDRPPVGQTTVGGGTKIDNLVQIAHGVQVGRHVFLAAQVGIAGSTVVGDHVMLGGQVGVGGHLEIGEGARAAGQTGISTSVDPGEFVSGYPAMPNLEWRKSTVVFRHLPEMRKALQDLQKRVSQLEAGRDDAPGAATE